MPEPLPTAYQSLTEQIPDWKTHEVQVDREHRLVKNVALTGQKSANGYEYSERALREGVPLYEQKPVFLDHAATPAQPHQRSARDLVGSVVNVRFSDGRIRGDVRVMDTEAGRTFLALVESNGPAVGMSHVVLAQKDPTGKLVEKIHEVVSVDAVVFPATTRTFQEQSPPSADGSRAVQPMELARLQSQRDALQQQIAALQQELREAEARREVDRLLDQAELPARAITDLFCRQLVAADSTTARRQLIQERRLLVEALRSPSGVPRSQERFNEEAGRLGSWTDEQLLAAIRAR